MKIARFNYTDAKGKNSERVILVLQRPSNKYTGIDLRELTERDQELYREEAMVLLDNYTKAMESLNEEFDVKYRYRQFIDSQMQHIVET